MWSLVSSLDYYYANLGFMLLKGVLENEVSLAPKKAHISENGKAFYYSRTNSVSEIPLCWPIWEKSQHNLLSKLSTSVQLISSYSLQFNHFITGLNIYVMAIRLQFCLSVQDHLIQFAKQLLLSIIILTYYNESMFAVNLIVIMSFPLSLLCKGWESGSIHNGTKEENNLTVFQIKLYFI